MSFDATKAQARVAARAEAAPALARAQLDAATGKAPALAAKTAKTGADLQK